jgi:hypothetical protein
MMTELGLATAVLFFDDHSRAGIRLSLPEGWPSGLSSRSHTANGGNTITLLVCMGISCLDGEVVTHMKAANSQPGKFTTAYRSTDARTTAENVKQKRRRGCGTTVDIFMDISVTS